MAKFNVRCGNCGYTGAILRRSAKDIESATCPKCQTLFLTRVEEPATSKIVETLDNGLMSRRVERPADAERLYKERAEADRKRRG